MALAELIARLEEEARTRVAAIQRDAESAVRAIQAAADATIRDETAAYLDRQRLCRQAAHARELAAARRRAHARRLEARRAQIARILECARERAAIAAASPRYAQAVAAHARDALSFVDGLQPRVRCDASFAATLQPIVDEHSGATLVVEDVGPGVVVESADGSVSIDNTLAARLTRAEPSLTIELSRRLGEGGD
jgi:vacuolar-type H+-ATPase subunit E/Vma4